MRLDEVGFDDIEAAVEYYRQALLRTGGNLPPDFTQSLFMKQTKRGGTMRLNERLREVRIALGYDANK